MKWLRFSLRSLLVLVTLAAFGSLGLRWYLDRPYARVERAMEAIWRDSPNASIFFDQGTGELYVENAEKVSTETAKALVDAELVRIAQITSQPSYASFAIDRAATNVIHSGAGYEHFAFAPPGVLGVGTEMIQCVREYDRNSERMQLHFDSVYRNRVERD